MTDLKGELASLKIDRSRKQREPLALAAAAARPRRDRRSLVLYGLRARQAFSAIEVETTTVAVSRDVQPSAGTPILTASGYVVARRKAVVSAKIQGRLSELRVEEGSRRARGRDPRPARVDRLRGLGRPRAGRGAARRGRPRRVPAPAAAVGGPGAPEDRLRGPARGRGEPREDRRGAGRPGGGRPRLRRGAAPEHGDPRALQRRRGEEDGRGRGERRARSRPA